MALEAVMVAMAVLIRESVASHTPPPDPSIQDCRLLPYSCKGTSACAAQLLQMPAAAPWLLASCLCAPAGLRAPVPPSAALLVGGKDPPPLCC